MDVQRNPSVKRNRRIRQVIYALLGMAAISGATVGLARLKPAAPTVEKGTIWPGEVKRGEMIRNVRGNGTLVPEDIRWIPATVNGRIEKLLVKPGAVVRADTVLLEMSNPELERDLLDAKTQLDGAKADLANQKVQLESARLNQQSQAATVRADYSQAKIDAEAKAQLAKEGLFSELELKKLKSRADELATRDQIEQKRLEIGLDAIKSQVMVYESRIQQFTALYELRRRQLDSLRVRAGMSGVVQEIPAQVGQQVAIGTNLARVADPGRLKAEVRIAETQARDIVQGLRAEIDTRNGVIEGRVLRVAPSAQQGTVLIEVALEGDLPRGARPDMGVDGTIEFERLENVLYMQRPAFGQEKGKITLFKIIEGGKEAVRVPVTLGRSSVSTIEIVEGLNVGDQVILSDTSQYDNVNRIRLN
jgi:HlyD family secretion protein